MTRRPSAALRIIAPALALVALVPACRSDHAQARRKTDHADGVSFDVPQGFRLERQKGSWVLVGESDHARATIAIRAVPVKGWSSPRTPDTVLPALLTTLRALPGAQVKGPTVEKDLRYRAYRYDVQFKPRSRHGEAYERRHVVLFGKARVFHVLVTAPADSFDNSRAAFQKVLDSVEEEG